MDAPAMKFAPTRDGLKIAYYEVGPGKALVLMGPVPLCNIRLEWELNDGNRILAQVLSSQNRRLVMFDPRGLGSSSPSRSFTLTEFALDLEAVADTIGLDQFDLVAVTYSCPIAVEFAARNPGRLSHLVLDMPFVNGIKALDTATGRAIRALRKLDWETYLDTTVHTIFREDSNTARQTAALLREANPETVMMIYDAVDAFDVEKTLPIVRTPTLVTYRRQVQLVSREQSQMVASLIPNAQFTITDEANYLPIVGNFLGIFDTRTNTSEPPFGNAAPSFRTVLFTDLVGHTEMMSRLGDEAGRAVLREHEAITRNVLRDHAGTEVKTMGDGFMASFASVTRAVECAIALQRAFDQRNNAGVGAPLGDGGGAGGAAPGGGAGDRPAEPLRVRVGLNAGEPIEEDGDLFGATVILASRIAARADAGEILVADTVRGLCSGKGFLFSDRGDFVAKGFEDPVRIYEVRWEQ
jgi:class 3 adenylate cyclase/pimeloyl-ACP methyl ester carboxylesterase